MKITYVPNIGFQLDSENFNWNDGRDSVRHKLRNQHKDDDRVIEMSEFFGGDKSHDIEQRRDIYEDVNGEKNYFFLSYDEEDKLSELEINGGIEIFIKEIQLIFEKDINTYLEAFKKIGEKYVETEEGNYLFEDLKMTIANSESMGGEGNGLTYFYGARSIEHLIE